MKATNSTKRNTADTTRNIADIVNWLSVVNSNIVRIQVKLDLMTNTLSTLNERINANEKAIKESRTERKT